jgi:hypothetical protein
MTCELQLDPSMLQAHNLLAKIYVGQVYGNPSAPAMCMFHDARKPLIDRATQKLADRFFFHCAPMLVSYSGIARH